MKLFRYRDCWYLVNAKGDFVASGSKQYLTKLVKKNKYAVKVI